MKLQLRVRAAALAIALQVALATIALAPLRSVDDEDPDVRSALIGAPV